MSPTGWIISGVCIVIGLTCILFPEPVRNLNAIWNHVTRGYELDTDHILHWTGTYRLMGIVLVMITLLVITIRLIPAAQ